MDSSARARWGPIDIIVGKAAYVGRFRQ